MHEFDPPEQPVTIAWPSVRWLGWFVVGRLLRVSASGLVLAVCARLIWPAMSTSELSMVIVAGVLMWMPTSWTLLRVRLLPGPADPRLVDDEGAPLCPADLFAEVRAWHAEYLLGALPALLLAVWLVLSDFAGIGWAVGGVLGLWTLARLAPVAPGWSLSTAHVLMPLDRVAEARRRLEPWSRVPWLLGARRDEWLNVLARARFRCGDVSGALGALDDIRRPKRWQVADLDAMMRVATDPDAAEARARVLDDADDHRAVATLLHALAALHRTPQGPVDVDALVALADAGPASLSRQLRLVAAAACADSDPPRARDLLERGSWGELDLAGLQVGWPSVADPLRGLRSESSPAQPRL